jgi:hypothetical protein
MFHCEYMGLGVGVGASSQGKGDDPRFFSVFTVKHRGPSPLASKDGVGEALSVRLQLFYNTTLESN